ncbi:hypothetical protein [Levilactobacillus brevis]|uniref:Uncharacterized protein n=2 Tax=Levilactobacillus brevis TaxID=1580 RepID=M5ABD7_LEVBR|nr:hypothetical protein [Levilactobacillus brevis]OOV22340.1 hypothetical protein LG101_02240 [Levilactobacillus brevis]BAN06108.1 conserved hypothetical protein [Levilactobacillus brevis KB290]
MMSMQVRTVGAYLWSLAQGTLVLGALLAIAGEGGGGHWSFQVTPFVSWVMLSWLVCYPILRKTYRRLYQQNNQEMASYKKRSLDLQHQDMANSHQGYRWSPNGVSTNPWEYNLANTQSTDEILNPIYIFCVHQWITFLLLMFGPLLVLGVWLVKGIKWVVKPK